MTNPLSPSTDLVDVLRRAASRLAHPANAGRHGLRASVDPTHNGRGVALNVTDDATGTRTTLVKVHRPRGVWVTNQATLTGMDVRARAAFDAIAPDLRTLDGILPQGYLPGVWAILP